MNFDFNKVQTLENLQQSSLNSYLSISDASRLFADKISEAGLGSVNVIADGILHRFSTPTDKQNKQSGWYVLFPDHIPCGKFGSWKDGIEEDFIAIGNKNPIYSDVELRIIKEAIESAKKARLEEKKRMQDEAAVKALNIWNSSKDVTSHPYLIKKQIISAGVRQREDVLLIPIINSSGEIRNLQRIYKDGSKRFLGGGEVKGCYSYIQGDISTIYICEGFATGMSVHMATGSAVVVAFNSGNLLDAGRSIKNIISNSHYIIAADNDLFTIINGLPTNVGYEAAQAAAKELNASVVYPEFKDLSTKPTDFNDLMILEGLEQVKQQTYLSDIGVKISDWGVEIYEGKAPPVEWLVRNLLPASSPCLLAAAGGTGKGMLALDLALSIAEQKKGLDFNKPREWLGKEIAQHGKVVIMSAEDSRASVHQRLESLDPTEERRKSAKGNLFILPLPNAGGPMLLVSQEGYGKVYKPTIVFENLKKQLRRIKDLKLINIDPLASFVGVDINSDPQAGAFVLGLLANLAEELQTTILISHHMSKPIKGGITSAEEAKSAIRGTTALVDSVRLVLAVWPTNDEEFNKHKKELEKLEKTDLFKFAVVKTNAPADTRVYTAIRSSAGLLEKFESEYKPIKQDKILELLIAEIEKAAKIGRPFTKGRAQGLYARREELDEALNKLSRNKLEDAIQDLLDAGDIVAATYKGTIAKYLDVPTGQFAEGTGTIEPGYVKE